MTKIKVGRADDLSEGQTVKFPFLNKGRNTEGFVARHEGKLVAYENRCRHLPVRLDFPDAELFDREGTHIICQNHNAVYEPSTGLCVRGPCEGQSLRALPLEIVDGEIWVMV